MTDQEHGGLVRLAVQVAAGRVPVIAGIGTNSTAHAIDMARATAARGADGLLVVVPYYNKPMQVGLHRHFAAIHEATELPVILYDVPSRTGRNLDDETIVRLANLTRIVGLKDATGDLSRPPRPRRQLGSRFRLFSGDDATAFGFMAQGGDGCVSVTSNVTPALCVRMHAAWVAGQIGEAQSICLDLAELTAALFVETNPIPLKFALSLIGRMSPKLRPPLYEAMASTRVALGQAMHRLGLLDHRMATRSQPEAVSLDSTSAALAHL